MPTRISQPPLLHPAMVRDRRVPATIRVFAALQIIGAVTGWCAPDVARLGNITELGRQTVYKALHDLTSRGYIASDYDERHRLRVRITFAMGGPGDAA